MSILNVVFKCQEYLGEGIPPLNKKMKRWKSMVLISKEEAKEVRKRFPFAHIYRTARQKSKRHRYWCSEEPEVLNLIDRMRVKR